ncbi:hypothetical protein [Streptacidiphilus carbonis]|uniref:hypothetical protein n=1 Tax=Streptacidiphilus carbonis TaxID=105422 RepID=UPI0005A655B5|nr:hypothetical protein [Streptacidiphilus carbonis]
MRRARVQFVGGPLDGRVSAVPVNLAERVPPEHRTTVPARDGGTAQTLVYVREPYRTADGRRQWRYAFARAEAGAADAEDVSSSPSG